METLDEDEDGGKCYLDAVLRPQQQNNIYIMQSQYYARSVHIPIFTCSRKRWLIEQKWCIRTIYSTYTFNLHTFTI